jgi:putative DNA primase/helicase
MKPTLAAVAPYEADEPLPVHMNEDALALEFTRRHRHGLRYVHEWGTWMRWDGMRWARERTLAVWDMAREITRDVGASITNVRARARVQSAATVNAIVALARADRAHARESADFDRNPWLLNTPGGTVDLRTGAMHAHDRADNLTKVTPITPSMDGDTHLWRQCLATWTQGDEALEGFLRRLAGYFLTGSVKEERLPIIHGGGGNGKTKFVETLRAVMGNDYVTGVAMETLIVTSGEQHPTDLADLRGKRLAIATETDEGRRFAEAKVKALTGGDRIRARHMRRDFFEFDPTHKLLVVGNHRPTLRNTDEAMRRRLLLIPFEATISAAHRDRDLSEKLLAERPAILRWMIEGCAEWLANGLQPPPRVLAATEDYFESQDAFGRWRDECLIQNANAITTRRDAFTSWKTWAEARGEFVGNERRLVENLVQAGVDETRIGKDKTRAWLGIGIRINPTERS